MAKTNDKEVEYKMSLIIDGVTVATTIYTFWSRYALVMSRRFGADEANQGDLVDFLVNRPKIALALSASDRAVASFMGRKIDAPIDDVVAGTLKVLLYLYDETRESGILGYEDTALLDGLVADMEDALELCRLEGSCDGMVN